MNMEIFVLSKQTEKSDNELLKMPVGEYYELYLTNKQYNNLVQQQMQKRK